MTAYVIMIRERMRDPATFSQYAELAPRVVGVTLPEVLAFYGSHKELEGAAVDGVVLLEFPTMDDAQRWYDSTDYARARTFRHQAADYRVILVEGVNTPV